MDSEMHSVLEKQPMDIWREVTIRLDLFSVCKLYLTGSKTVIHMLKSGAVTDALLKWTNETMKLHWPTILKDLPSIASFEYNAGNVRGSACFYPTKQHLRLLGAKLKSFKLYSDGAEEAFYNDAESHDPEAEPGSRYVRQDVKHVGMNVGETWPLLERFSVKQFGTERYMLQEDVLRTLPPTLTRFSLPSLSGTFKGEMIAALPQRLTRLTLLHGSFHAYRDLQHLPPSLLVLKMGRFKESYPEEIGEEDPEKHFLAKLPPSITYLRLDALNLTFQEISLLPRGLRQLILTGCTGRSGPSFRSSDDTLNASNRHQSISNGPGNALEPLKQGIMGEEFLKAFFQFSPTLERLYLSSFSAPSLDSLLASPDFAFLSKLKTLKLAAPIYSMPSYPGTHM
jgi:hypothetical protein